MASAGEISGPVWGGDRWVWLVRAMGKPVGIVGAHAASNQVARLDTIWKLPPFRQGQDAYLRADSSEVIAGEFRRPFRIWVFRRDGSHLTLTPPAKLLANFAGARDSMRWVALSAHRLDSGYVQLFADLNADTRILHLYGLGGRSIRWLGIEAPFGILDALSSRRVLLIFRHINRPEIALYTWTWQRAANATEPSAPGR